MVPPNDSNTTTEAITGLLQEIRSSSILTERQLEKLDAKIAEGEYPQEPAELAAQLVKEGIVTEYQARQVVKGKAKGLIFGGYIILDFLGKGTMGKVYKARHRMMGRIVALKVLDPRYVSSTRTLARFQREMQLVGRLDHPNVVRAFDADRVVDCHFIAMEYAAGYTLDDLLKAKGALPPADVVFYASQAADGLAHAHARGVLHRDIKPSNLLLTEGRKLKILDFGLGTLVEKDDLPAELTAAGITVGTPDYISPEQARMVKLDGRSDLYSLGCTMYHLLSGQLPFKGESSMDCIVGRITGQPIPIEEVRPGLPPRLVQSLEKMMATNPDDRFQTADEAAVALRSLLRPKNATPGRPVPAAPAPTPAAAAPAPAPVAAPVPQARGAATVEATPLPPRAGTRSAKPKQDSLRSRLASRGTKANRVLAAVAALALIAITFMLFRSSTGDGTASQQESDRPVDVASVSSSSSDEHPAPQPASVAAKTAPVVPAGGAAVRESSPGVDKPKQEATAAMSGADVRKPNLIIESPAQGATVDMREELTGRLESGGWPVIFVQADIPGQPWWCQAAVENVDGGRFTTKVVFGDELTPHGMKFRIVGIVARTRDEALKFEIGSKQLAVPEGFPRSAEVVVTHH